jgi:aerobic carbon-monoxide dehydrogenase medium subunit
MHINMNALPRLPEFDYFKPETISEAFQFLSTNAGEARLFLGGTDLLVQMRERKFKAKYLVDVKGLEGLNDITYDPDRGLSIGAAVNMNRVIAFQEVREHYPGLAQAAESVASYQLRSRATIVGNICNASPAGDTIGACLLLDGVLHIYGEGGMIEKPLRDFFLGPGLTALKKGEIVTSIEFPVPPEGLVSRYFKLGRNKLSDLAIVGVTAIGFPDTRSISGYRMKIALASVAPTPLIIDQVEEILSKSPITEESLVRASQAAMDACKPIDDVRASAHYRRYMVRNLSLRAMQEVWKELYN